MAPGDSRTTEFPPWSMSVIMVWPGGRGGGNSPVSLPALAAAGGWSHYLGLAGLAEVGAGGAAGRGTSDFGMLISHISFIV